jgi:3-deoxy-D-manno-octulosonic-acid transferase
MPQGAPTGKHCPRPTRRKTVHRFVYSCLMALALPFTFARLLGRSIRQPDYRRHWAQRLGFAPGAPAGSVWLHAVSVGEVNAAVPLVDALLGAYPGLPVLVTTTTPTGAQQVRLRLGDRVQHSYLPYDVPGACARFMRRQRPRLGIIMETELWPNLYAAAAAYHVPLLLANARLSARSARGYGRWAALTRQTLDRLSVVGAQTAADAERFAALGLPRECLTVTGNLKFDANLPDAGASLALRERLGPTGPVWLAASTHEGEEAIVLATHRTIRARYPRAILILAPRHPQRFDEVSRLASAQGWPTVRRSDDAGGDCAVYVADTLGELPALMAAADVVFVGGSLGCSASARGGHNLIEPAQVARPILFGPYMHNFTALREQVIDAGAGTQVAGKDELVAALTKLFDDVDTRRRMGAAGAALVAQHRGATARTLSMVRRFLDCPQGGGEAGGGEAGAVASSQPLTRARSS